MTPSASATTKPLPTTSHRLPTKSPASSKSSGKTKSATRPRRSRARAQQLRVDQRAVPMKTKTQKSEEASEAKTEKSPKSDSATETAASRPARRPKKSDQEDNRARDRSDARRLSTIQIGFETAGVSAVLLLFLFGSARAPRGARFAPSPERRSRLLTKFIPAKAATCSRARSVLRTETIELSTLLERSQVLRRRSRSAAVSAARYFIPKSQIIPETSMAAEMTKEGHRSYSSGRRQHRAEAARTHLRRNE